MGNHGKKIAKKQKDKKIALIELRESSIIKFTLLEAIE